LAILLFIAAAYSITLYRNTQYGRLARGYQKSQGESSNLLRSHGLLISLLFALIFIL
jgi:hypothetical protein